MSENQNYDPALLQKFEEEVWNKIPHKEGDKIVNATPLVDLTADLKECAKSVFKLDLDNNFLFLLIDHLTISTSEQKESTTHSYSHILKTFK